MLTAPMQDVTSLGQSVQADLLFCAPILLRGLMPRDFRARSSCDAVRSEQRQRIEGQKERKWSEA